MLNSNLYLSDAHSDPTAIPAETTGEELSTVTIGESPAEKPAPLSLKDSSGVMLRGMVTIFIVTAVIILGVFLLNKLCRKKTEE